MAAFVFFLKFLVIETLDPNSLESFIRIQLILIRNAA
jgi:hypothetical protein